VCQVHNDSMMLLLRIFCEIHCVIENIVPESRDQIFLNFATFNSDIEEKY
jgi:hypothetical protein